MPLVQLAVDEVLGLVGGGAGREGEEVADVLQRQVLEQFVRDGEGLPCASWPHAQHLGERVLMQAERSLGVQHTGGAATLSLWEASHPLT